MEGSKTLRYFISDWSHSQSVILDDESIGVINSLNCISGIIFVSHYMTPEGKFNFSFVLEDDKPSEGLKFLFSCLANRIYGEEWNLYEKNGKYILESGRTGKQAKRDVEALAFSLERRLNDDKFLQDNDIDISGFKYGWLKTLCE